MKSSMGILISSIIIGASLVISSVIFGNAIAGNKNQQAKTSNDQGKVLMTIEEAAQYLNMSKEEVQNIIISEKKTLERSGTFNGEFFPYFTINNKVYVSRDALSRWISDTSMNRREYLASGEVFQ